MESFLSKVSFVFVCVTAFLCYSCKEPQQTGVGSDVMNEPTVIGRSAVILDPAPEDANIVAVIEDLSVTKEELRRSLLDEMSPRSFPRVKNIEDVNVQKVLLKIVAEKAMAIEGRKLGYLSDEGIERQMKRFRERLLFNMIVGDYLKDKEIEVTQQEVELKLKENPRLNAERARAALHNEKTSVFIDSLYRQLTEKLNIRKSDENLARAVAVYQRLLDNSTSQVMKFVTHQQMQNDLTQDEKLLELVVYDGGKVTLEEWLETLNTYSPPSRSSDLNTPAGFEDFLDKAILKKSIIIAGARALGFDKKPEFLEQVKSQEDFFLTRKVKLEMQGLVNEPSTEEIIAYFNEHKEDFMSPPDVLRIDQIWCPNIKIARLVKEELDKGAVFEDAKKRYSVVKTTEPMMVTARAEGIFFPRLWAYEPNDVIGPVGGFYKRGVGLRVVKILEKTPGEQVEYSPRLNDDIKNRMYAELLNKRFDEYGKELLKKYKYGICPDRFADLVDFCRSLE
jgi:hypothetical protein